ncbi:MAG TPA: type IV secretory system conjugative DNA transfer family protein [Nitrosospira sp.]|nr:type IV secretory system conjugative DNA transfer family protein [Nitrosospira sp.]
MSDKNTSPVMARLIGLAYMAAILIIASSVSTQFMAGRFAYHPSLGQPLFWKLYNPFDWWTWVVRFYGSSPTTCNYAFGIFALGFFIAILVARLTVGFKSRSSRKHEGTHGTAKFATAEQIKGTGLLPRDGESGAGVYCGGYDDERTGQTRYLRHNGPEHICAIAPTRSGKGVGLVVPTLLSWPDSVFVLDIKGELWALTSGWRRKHANNIVLRFDPASEDGSCSWNPLAEIRFGTRYQISDAQNIALMVVDSDGKGLNDHWRKAAFELLGGVIMHALYKSPAVGRVPCLKDCAEILTNVGDFSAPDGDSKEPQALVNLFMEMRDVALDETNPAAREASLYIRGVGRSMAEKPEKERGSVISTANNELSLYRDPIVGHNTSRSDFKIADLMDEERPVSLYFITDPNDMDRLKPLTRLLLTQIVTRLTGRLEYHNGRSKTAHKHRLLLMLDEFPSLGSLKVFQSAFAFIAGYGIKAYIIIQDVAQLRQAYTDNESIISNCHVLVAYATNQIATAKWLSEMTGQSTVIKEQITTSGKRFGGPLSNVSRSYQEVQRPLMTADEIRRLAAPTTDENGIVHPGELLIFVAGNPVIKGRQILYFIDPTFSKRSMIKPPKTSDAVRKAEQPQSGFALP